MAHSHLSICICICIVIYIHRYRYMYIYIVFDGFDCGCVSFGLCLYIDTLVYHVSMFVLFSCCSYFVYFYCGYLVFSYLLLIFYFLVWVFFLFVKVIIVYTCIYLRFSYYFNVFALLRVISFVCFFNLEFIYFYIFLNGLLLLCMFHFGLYDLHVLYYTKIKMNCIHKSKRV